MEQIDGKIVEIFRFPARHQYRGCVHSLRVELNDGRRMRICSGGPGLHLPMARRGTRFSAMLNEQKDVFVKIDILEG